MAVKLEFISVIVPVKNIKAKCEAGYWEDYVSRLDMNCWHDSHLFREGAMNPYDIETMMEGWAQHGLKPFGWDGDKKHWKDLCVVDYRSGLTLPCEWLRVDLKGHCVWYAGEPRGEIIGPSDRDIMAGIKIIPDPPD